MPDEQIPENGAVISATRMGEHVSIFISGPFDVMHDADAGYYAGVSLDSAEAVRLCGLILDGVRAILTTTQPPPPTME